MTTFVSVTLEDVSCGSCGVVFGLSTEYIRARRDDHASFYCPNGHSLHYLQKNEAERLRERLNWAENQSTHLRDQLQATEYQRRAIKGQLTKTRKRIAGGVCPCCNRSFVDLGRHMAGQHPDYTKERS